MKNYILKHDMMIVMSIEKDHIIYTNRVNLAQRFSESECDEIMSMNTNLKKYKL